MNKNTGQSPNYLEFLWKQTHSEPALPQVLQDHRCNRLRMLFEQEEINIFAEPLYLRTYFLQQIKALTENTFLWKSSGNINWITRKLDECFEICEALDKSNLLTSGYSGLTVFQETKVLVAIIKFYLQLNWIEILVDKSFLHLSHQQKIEHLKTYRMKLESYLSFIKCLSFENCV
ncbi:uncharacterized protein LOC143226811 [Tachypleus tridentatus]|uniref:uncharacterized protein LOC143226811 n=1 Tax=Tachypleus tridentatus TaxID=6853 RepID=UPI003FD1ABE8